MVSCAPRPLKMAILSSLSCWIAKGSSSSRLSPDACDPESENPDPNQSDGGCWSAVKQHFLRLDPEFQSTQNLGIK